MIRKGLYILMALVAAMMGSGCAGDSPEEGGVGTVRFVILAVGNNMTVSRAADGVVAEPESDTEKINDWWMAIVQSDGKVRKIITRSLSNPGLGDYTSETLPAVEEEYFECDLPKGTYTVYAFANITTDELALATGISFTVGQKPSGVDNISSAIWEDTELNLWSKDKNVPMSGMRTITVKNTVEETFSIEVVRMVAKIEFQFKNQTEDKITVNSISIDPITSTAVSLFPQYDILGKDAYTPLADAKYKMLIYPVSETEANDGSTEGVAKGNGGKVWFYCKESIANTHNDRFTIGVNITRTSKTGDETVIKQEEQRYSPTDIIKGYINRNDWIVIPITFTDWIVEFDVKFYPPIGGYPAVLVADGTDAYSRYFTFASQGKFVITPYVRKAIEGSPWLQPEQYLPEKTADGDNGLAVSDPDKIFSVSPTIDEYTREITGELAMTDNKGTAIVTLIIQPHDTSDTNYSTYTYKLYIIRQ